MIIMALKEQFEKRKQQILDDKIICKENRELFTEFFLYQEKKLKRKNDLEKLDDGCYRTLLSYILKFRNINGWFKNKPWKDLTKEDITKVYDNLEDGIIKNSKGESFKDKQGYYSKVMKSKPFALAGKRELAEEVIEYSNKKKKPVRYFTEEDLTKMVSVIIQPKHKCIIQLGWDIGENISSLLQLKKRDLTKQLNQDTKEPEYLIHLKEDILKRARTSRTEPTNYIGTAQLLDLVLKDKGEEDPLFDFGVKQVEKVFNRAIRITSVKVMPEGLKPQLKDIRSSMACHLLKCGWSTDEVKARLGHKPSSTVIDVYASYLALEKHKPKKKIYNNDLQQVREDLERIKQQGKLKTRKIDGMTEDIENNSQLIHKMYDLIEDLEIQGKFKQKISETKGRMLKAQKELLKLS